jgi:CBS domain-containing protein
MISESKFVVDIMTPNPVIVSPETTSWLAEVLAQKRCVHDLLVVDGYRLAGVVCRCDLRRAGAKAMVRDFMRANAVTIDDQQTAGAARDILERSAIGCLPVVDWSGCLRGVVTRRDLVNAGVLDGDRVPTCNACGSTHGLPADLEEGEVRFCARCVEQSRQPRSQSEAAYFDVGGGD